RGSGTPCVEQDVAEGLSQKQAVRGLDAARAQRKDGQRCQQEPDQPGAALAGLVWGRTDRTCAHALGTRMTSPTVCSFMLPASSVETARINARAIRPSAMSALVLERTVGRP